MTLWPHDLILSHQLIHQPEVSELGTSLMVVVVLGVLNPMIKIVYRRVRGEGMVADLRPPRITKPGSPEGFVLIGRRGMTVLAFTSRRLDASFPRSTRHDEDEGDGDEDDSKEVSGKGDFKRRHAETPPIVSLVLSNQVTPL